jgi:hypothetical protein
MQILLVVITCTKVYKISLDMRKARIVIQTTPDFL